MQSIDVYWIGKWLKMCIPFVLHDFVVPFFIFTFTIYGRTIKNNKKNTNQLTIQWEQNQQTNSVDT